MFAFLCFHLTVSLIFESLRCMARAQDAKKQIYDVKFNLKLRSGQPHIFATVGADRINIFECDKDGGLRILQVYSDPEVRHFLQIILRFNHSADFSDHRAM